MKEPYGIMMVHSGVKVFIRLLRNKDEVMEMAKACETLMIPYKLFEQLEDMPLYYGEMEVFGNDEDQARP